MKQTLEGSVSPRLRWTLLLLVAAGGSLLAFTSLRQLRSESSLGGFAALDDATRREFEDFSAHFGPDDILLLTLQSDGGALRRGPLEALSRLTDALEESPHTEDAISLASVEELRIKRLLGSPLPLPPRPLLPKDLSQLDEARVERIRADPFLTEGLLSKDGNTLALWVLLRPELRQRGDFDHQIQSLVELARGEIGESPDLKLGATGFALLQGTLRQLIQHHGVRVSLIALLIILGVAAWCGAPRGSLLAFLLAWPVLIALLFGLFILLDRPITVFTTNLLPLLIIITGSLLLHLAHAGRSESRRRFVLRLCFFASATTALGFGSLSASPLDSVSAFGSEAMIATLLAWAVVGAFLHFAPRGRPLRHPRRWRPGRIWKGRSVAIAGILVALPWLLVDTGRIGSLGDFVAYLPERHPLVADTVSAQKAMGSLLTCEIVVHLGPNGRERLLDPEFHGKLAGFQERLLNHAHGEIAFLLGPVSLLAYLNTLLDASADAWERPEAAAPFAIRWLLRPYLDSQGKSIPEGTPLAALQKRLGQVVSSDGSRVRFNARLRTPSPELILSLRSELQVLFLEESGRMNAESIHFTGTSVAVAETTRNIKRSQIHALLAGGLLMSLALLFILRDARLLLAALLANAATLSAVGTLLWMSRAELNLYSTVLTATLLGIIVDDTIHFLMSWKEASGSPRLRCARALLRSGPGIRGTTLALVCGFAAFLLSPLPLYRQFCLTASGALLLALFFDLALLPRLVVRLARN